MLARLRRTTTQDDTGASAVEYGLLVAAIAAVIIVAVFAFGGFVQNIFNETCDEVAGQINDGASDPELQINQCTTTGGTGGTGG
jgi:pilus assembly protein Flp/PilA